jgi:hypothetical protein
VATWSALWRHGVGTSGIVATCPDMCTTVGEWFLSFGVVATCPVIPGPIAGVAYLSL